MSSENNRNETGSTGSETNAPQRPRVSWAALAGGIAMLVALGVVLKEREKNTKPMTAQGAFSAGLPGLVEALPKPAEDPGKDMSEEEIRGAMNTQIREGDKAFGERDVPGARKAYEAALALAEKLEAKAPAGAPPASSNLAVLHIKVGDAAQAANDLPAARASYAKAAAILEAMSAADPKSTSIRRDLAVTYSKLGHATHGGGDAKGATALFEKSVASTEALLEADPKSAIVRNDLAVAQTTLASVVEAAGDLERARDLFEAALKSYKTLAKDTPKDGAVALGLASTHARLAHLAARRKDTKAAREHKKAAEKVLDAMDQAGLAKGNAGYDNLLAYVKSLKE